MNDQESVRPVIHHIEQLHKGGDVKTANEWLSAFQQQPIAWETCSMLLNQGGGCHSTHVLHYAAQTMCVKAQTGLAGIGVPAATCKDTLLQLIQKYCAGPMLVTRQLVLALCAIVLHTAEWQDPVGDIVSMLSPQPLHPVLLEFLSLLPEEQKNERVLIDPQRKATFGIYMVGKTELVVQTLTAIVQGNPNEQQAVERPVLKAYGSWLAGQWAIAQPDNSTHPILSTLMQSTLFQLLLKRLQSTNQETTRICGEAVSEILGLSDQLNNVTDPIIVSILEAMLGLMEALSREGLNDTTETCCKTLCRLLGEIAENHFPNLLYADSPQHKPILSRTVDMALQLLSSPNFVISEAVLDFWYNLLSHHLCTPEEASAQNFIQTGESIYQHQARLAEAQQKRAGQRHHLIPLYKRMVEVLVTTVRYPSQVNDTFEFDEFARVREHFAISLTEACVVVGPEWVLELIGNHLRAASEKATQGSFPWEEVEGNIFVLTTVAPRAKAGADAVIPQMLTILPELPFPSNGYGALLLRCAAGRLVQFTSGYLGNNLEKCLPLFKLFTERIVPDIATFDCADTELKVNTEAQVVNGLLMMVHEAAPKIVQESHHVNVLQALGALIVNTKLSIEGRCNVVMAAGAVISSLPVEAMSQCLNQLIAPLADSVKDALGKNGDTGTVTKATKLFFVALQSVRPTVAISSDVQHPVVACLSHHWNFVETAVQCCAESETVMQDACHSLTNILHVARSHTQVVVMPFLSLIVKCFQKIPMIFHLGAARTVMGVFGSTKDPELLKNLSEAMQILGQVTLQKMQDESFVVNLPDIIGMYYDALAGALQPPPLANRIIHSEWISPCLVGALQTLLNCQHQKAMCAMLLFVTRLMSWVNRPMIQTGEYAPLYQETIPKSRKLVVQHLSACLHTLIACLASSAKGVQHATPLIASCLQPLMGLTEAPAALHHTLQELPQQFMADHYKAEFYNTMTTEKDVRAFALFCQDTAEHCAAQWKKYSHAKQ